MNWASAAKAASLGASMYAYSALGHAPVRMFLALLRLAALNNC